MSLKPLKSVCQRLPCFDVLTTLEDFYEDNIPILNKDEIIECIGSDCWAITGILVDAPEGSLPEVLYNSYNENENYEFDAEEFREEIINNPDAFLSKYRYIETCMFLYDDDFPSFKLCWVLSKNEVTEVSVFKSR